MICFGAAFRSVLGAPLRMAEPRRCQATPHRRHGMVDQEISQHRAAEGSDERCHHRVSQGRAPLSQNRKCERFWTLPFSQVFSYSVEDQVALIIFIGAIGVWIVILTIWIAGPIKQRRQVLVVT